MFPLIMPTIGDERDHTVFGLDPIGMWLRGQKTFFHTQLS